MFEFHNQFSKEIFNITCKSNILKILTTTMATFAAFVFVQFFEVDCVYFIFVLYCAVAFYLNGFGGSFCATIIGILISFLYKHVHLFTGNELYKTNSTIFFLFILSMPAIYRINVFANNIKIVRNQEKNEEIINWVRDITNKPLTAISSSILAIKANVKSEEGQEIVNIMVSCIENIKKQISLVDGLYKTRNGLIEIVEVEAFCREILIIVSQQAKKKNQSLTYKISKDCPKRIGCCTLKVQHILINFLFNAIKYTQAHGHITLSFDVRKRGGENKYLTISVIDDGMGIEKDEITKIFDDYHQSSRAVPGASSYGGVGLGLPIAMSISKTLGAKLSVKSDGINKGSTFTLKLPYVEVDEAAESVKANEAMDIQTMAPVHTN